MTKQDWVRAESEYVTTGVTLSAIARKYGCTESAVRKQSARNGWKEKRRQHCAAIVGKASEAAADREAQKLASLIRSADRLTSVIEAAVADESQFYRYIVREHDKAGTGYEERVFQKLDTKSLREMAGAIKELSAAIRGLNDLPDAAERERRQAARERLALVRQKASAGRTAADETGVVLMPPVDSEEDG